MKKLQKEFVGNFDRVGNNKFVQIRKENDVAIYERQNMDGTFRSYEVFIVKVIPKGASLPNGSKVSEAYEQYPGSSAFGRTAYDCKTIGAAEERFDELVKKAKESRLAKEQAEASGEPVKKRGGRRSVKEKVKIELPKKNTKFSMKLLIAETKQSQPQLHPIVKQWLADGLIEIAEKVKAEGGRGRPSYVYIVK